MHFVIAQTYKSNKSETYITITAPSEADAKERAMTMLNSSIDVASVEVYLLIAVARKTEVAQWD